MPDVSDGTHYYGGMDAGERLESIKVPNWVQETGGVPYCVMLGV